MPRRDADRTADERYVNEFIRALDGFTAEPWWWQAAGHTTDEWERDRRRAAIANKCPVRIHDQPIFCDLTIGSIGFDGFARCNEPWIRHVLRPTGDPDRPWADTGRRERVSVDA